MSTDFEEQRKKAYVNRRSVMDWGMGIIIAGFGLFFAFSEKLGFQFDLDPLFRWLFAGLCIVYGFFRMYRGYKKNYFKE